MLEYFISNKEVLDSLLYTFLSLSIILSIFCYLSLSPFKSSIFLVLTFLMVIPTVGFSSYGWYPYYMALLFVSGIFVFMVYIASMSGLKVKFMLNSWLIIIMILFFYPSIYFVFWVTGMFTLYYFNYFFVIMYLIVVLLLFMNFLSFMIVNNGALRNF
uniref:NADH dehydrogenase subunit 6 n=1 Tax=Ruizia karukerae TaxID=2201929 RepID=A0A343YNA2_9BILA|nr:NADH dehydrogenase subunit 6 [Ruizia karukerae]